MAAKLCRRASILAVLALVLVPSALAKHAQEERYVPDPSVEGAPRLSGATWIAEPAGAIVRIQRIGEDARRSYLAHVTGTTSDPFANRPGEPPRFQTFVVEIENTGAVDLTFQPESAWLVGEGAEVQFPIGLEKLRADYSLVKEQAPLAYDRAGPALLEGSRQLAPGARAAGLLVYHSVEPGTKRFRIELTLTSGSGDEIRVRAPYRRLKRGESAQGSLP